MRSLPRVLIVEDEPAIAELIAVNLRHNGFQPFWAEDGEAAQRELDAVLPDVILLDWMLPGESGLSLARKWRADARTRSVPILMLTARGDEADRVAGLDVGADDYITKPFSTRELLARIRAVLRRRAPEQAGASVTVGDLALDPATYRVTWMGQAIGWRSAYWFVAVVALGALAMIAVFVPRIVQADANSVMQELRAFGSMQVALTFIAGSIGFGGMFAMYSYVAPLITEVAGQPERFVPVALFAFGLGGIVGNTIGGRMSDWSVLRTIVIASVGMSVVLVVLALVATWFVAAVLFVFIASLVAAILAVGVMMRLITVANSAKTLGAASAHASLNIANAVGAWLGGIVIARGHGYAAPSLVGAVLALGGLVVFGLSILFHKREQVAMDVTS